MTDFEKKIKRYHNKKMNYNKDSEAIIRRLRQKEAEKYDFSEDRSDVGYYMLDKKYSYPRKARKKAQVLWRIIAALIGLTIIIWLSLEARTNAINNSYSIIPEGIWGWIF